jgi:hypothetical protein
LLTKENKANKLNKEKKENKANNKTGKDKSNEECKSGNKRHKYSESEDYELDGNSSEMIGEGDSVKDGSDLEASD